MLKMYVPNNKTLSHNYIIIPTKTFVQAKRIQSSQQNEIKLCHQIFNIKKAQY